MIRLIANALGRQVVGERAVEVSPGDKDSGTTMCLLRRSKGNSLVAGAVFGTWRPCWTPATAVGHADDLRDDRGRLVPHVYFASAYGAGCQSILCRECRVARATRELARRGGRVDVCPLCDLPHRHVGGSAASSTPAPTTPAPPIAAPSSGSSTTTLDLPF